MKYIAVTILFILSLSCKKQEIKLPQLHAETMKEVYNNSQIWIFYTLKDKDTVALLNKNNSISTTNWLFNIDRRLQLKHIFKAFKTQLDKRQTASIHHVDGLQNYFSFSDTLDKQIKFLPIKTLSIQYKTPDYKDSICCNIAFYKYNFKLNNTIFNYNQLDSVLYQNLQNRSNSVKIQIFYKDDLSYNTYVSIKAKLLKSPFRAILETPTDFYFK